MSRASIAVRRWRLKHPQLAAAIAVVARCKKAGTPCDPVLLRSIECPRFCPVLGTPINFARGRGHRPPENTASFDRIDPAGGYVVGNVIIISKKANAMKSDATVQQLCRFAQWVLTDYAECFAPV